MIRVHHCILAAAAVLAGCAPQPEQTPRGAGFDSLQAIEAREAQLQGGRVPYTVLPPAGGTGAPAPLSGTGALPGSPEETAAETARILAETRPQMVVEPSTTAQGVVTPVTTGTGAIETAGASGAVTNPLGISNENNFDAVSGQRSIEGDAARLAQNRAQYQVVEPRALPERTGDSQPNIVAFALATSHPVGQRVYARAGLDGATRAARNCRDYPSPDQAQIDFLARGGPERDRRGLDPDGDGYACGWDPSPFRKASQG